MIDTVDMYFKFKSKKDYDACYAIIDECSKQQANQRLHKKNKMPRYITTAFADKGFLEIAFEKHKSKDSYYFIKIFLQPIRLLQPNNRIEVSHFNDYREISKRFDLFIDLFNPDNQPPILPSLKNWIVSRIDYAMNIPTPHVKDYLQLFYAGHIPTGFSNNTFYPDSFYLASQNGRINFYNKIHQLIEKHHYTPEYIEKSFPLYAPGLLRLEFQCSNRYIQYLKSIYAIKKPNLRAFWKVDIAEYVLKSRIGSVIGTNDFYSLTSCFDKLMHDQGTNRTNSLCYKLILNVKQHSTLDKAMHSFCTQYQLSTSYANQLIKKIRDAAINPIPLDILPDTPPLLESLQNPYHLINFKNKSKIRHD